MRKVLILLLVLPLALTACVVGGGDDDSDSNSQSIEDAETCEDVADYFAVVAQDFINDAEDAGMTGLAAGAESDVIKEYQPELEASQAKAQELGCDEEAMRPLLSERVDGLETDGPVGDFIVDFLRDQGFGE